MSSGLVDLNYKVVGCTNPMLTEQAQKCMPVQFKDNRLLIQQKESFTLELMNHRRLSLVKVKTNAQRVTLKLLFVQGDWS